MTNKRLIILFWVLLMVPALIISAAALRLLLHEQERINRSVLVSLTDRARSVALAIHETVRGVEERLSQALVEIDPQHLQDTLLSWEQTNPLVRNVFIWQEDTLLSYPVEGMVSTREERDFMNRFESFFSGRLAFDAAVLTTVTENPGGDVSRANEQADPSFYSGATEYPSPKEALFDLAKGKSPISKTASMAQTGIDPSIFSEQGGWIPWFSQNQLFILGWVRTSQTGPVYGMELELVSLLSRLIMDLPRMEDSGVCLAILDSKGQVVHQSGNVVVDPDRMPDISVTLSRLLPHWQIGVYLDKEAFSSGRAFFYVSVMLLFIFLVAIVSGGGLLTWQAIKHMKEAMQKTSFVSSVSHELKTPLTSIRMYAELLQSGRVTSAEKTEHYLSVMVSESQRLTRLINNVLDFGKLEQGKKTYRIMPVDLKQMLIQMIDAHSIRIKNEGFEIRTDIGPGEFKVETDQDAVEQVVLNLIDNALKYAVDGRFIAFVLEGGPKGDVVLKICDRGPGIDLKHRHAIFEKFYRIDNTLTSTRPGSGLGLSIARRILMDLGGNLQFEPMTGGGSCFIIRIPGK